jgi:hypothetical protein
MSSTDSLRKALAAIDSNKLRNEFLADATVIQAVANGCERVALWSNQLVSAEPDNPAAPFLHEMQRSSHDVAALLSVALYIPAAAAMRTTCETAIYYTYFRNHSAELATLATNPDYYISKAEVLEFHKVHSPSYRMAARTLGFPTELDIWYGKVSAVIHGQVPGAWGRRLALKDTKHEAAVLKLALKMYAQGTDVIHKLLLLTAGAELWGRFHHEAKKAWLKGMPAEQRTLLGLDGK